HDIPVRVGHLPHAGHFIAAKWKASEYAATLEQLTGVLTATQPDVVVANTLGNFPMVEAAVRADIPCVWIIHESYTREQMVALHSPFALLRCHAALHMADRALIASHATAGLFAARSEEHTSELQSLAYHVFRLKLENE